MSLIEKMRRKDFKPRGQWNVRVTNLNPAHLRSIQPELQDLVMIILTKVEQLTRIEELEKALELITFLMRELKKTEHTYQVNFENLKMKLKKRLVPKKILF